MNKQVLALPPNYEDLQHVHRLIAFYSTSNGSSCEMLQEVQYI